MDQNWCEYYRTLEKELGGELAREFVASLHSQSRGSVDTAEQFFYQLGAMWAPLMSAWGSWVEENAQGTIAMILRDAKPLSALPTTGHWKSLYLNRLVCGVADELSGDKDLLQHPLLGRYLAQNGCSDGFTFVDSGCYGTVVLQLHRLGLSFRPLFFFSKNPQIRGFLNECGVSLADGEILNDSLECGFPHTYARPSELIEADGSVQVSLRPADLLSTRFGDAAMRGVKEAPLLGGVSGRDAAELLLDLSRQARIGQFTGVLGQTSPEWTQKDAFLREWPKELCWA